MILSVMALSMAACVPAPAPGHAGASNLPWYISGDVITLGKAKYSKYGLPRILREGDVELLAPYKGGFVFAEKGNPQREVVYLLTRFDECEFQPYQIEQ
jgi:hypothetical protein